jgi:hypothetical protein
MFATKRSVETFAAGPHGYAMNPCRIPGQPFPPERQFLDATEGPPPVGYRQANYGSAGNAMIEFRERR